MTEPARLDLDTAAAWLGVPATTVTALVERGFLAAADGPSFYLTDLKAFLARNADNGTGAGLLDAALAPELAPEELVDLLDERSEQMAWRVFKIFAAVFPEADEWPAGKQGAFVEEAKGRFEAILAVSELGTAAEDALFEELREIGASAARTGASLSHLLVLLRMSRDLMVQTAVELAEGDGRHGGFALALLLTKILPAMDRLSDSLTKGYWEAVSHDA